MPQATSSHELGSGTTPTLTSNCPVLFSHSNPSIVPRNSLVAPVGTMKFWLIFVFVRPSPMKKTCFSPGASVVKLRPIVPKSSPPGAAVRFGCVSSRNRPSSELIGAFTSAIPFSAPVKWEIKPPPSGGKQPHVGVLLTPPVAEKMSIEPGTSVRETKTGDSAGAESSIEAVEPEGIPASQGSEVPGTFMLAALATAASVRESSVERVDDKGKSSSELISMQSRCDVSV